MQPIRVGIIGVGGFARKHLSILAALQEQGECRLEAAVIHLPQQFAAEEAVLKQGGVRIYRSYEDLYHGEQGALDLVIIPVGIHLHAPMSIAGLRAGFNVLCEKPAAGTVAEVDAMIQARRASDRFLAIGFQHVYTRSLRRIKELALNGDLGRLLEAKSYALWPRTASYYSRNDWAGRVTVDNKPVYDSPIQNAVAHYFNNLLFVAGPSPLESAEPLEVWGENLHAMPIESADTQFIRVKTTTGVLLQFWVSHACPENVDPVAEYRFERGLVHWDINGNGRVLDREGRLLETLSNGTEDAHTDVHLDLYAALRNGGSPGCPVTAARAHVVCVNALFSKGVGAIEGAFTELVPGQEGKDLIISGITKDLKRAYEAGRSFSELGLPWAPPLERCL